MYQCISLCADNYEVHKAIIETSIKYFVEYVKNVYIKTKYYQEDMNKYSRDEPCLEFKTPFIVEDNFNDYIREFKSFINNLGIVCAMKNCDIQPGMTFQISMSEYKDDEIIFYCVPCPDQTDNDT